MLTALVERNETHRIKVRLEDTGKSAFLPKPKGEKDPLYDRLERRNRVFLQMGVLVTNFNHGDEEAYYQIMFGNAIPTKKQFEKMPYYAQRVFSQTGPKEYQY
jgi:hypothetical protein